MNRRYLFGPVTAPFADQHLEGERRAGRCLTFGGDGSSGLAIGPGDSWEGVCARLPEGWRPDFVALYLPYTSVPPCVWSAPIPLVGLAADWNLQWHWYRRALRRCDLVLTDAAGVEVMQREGIEHARAGNLFGCGREYLGMP
jgi:hypothetical protein